jgi:hypothetical protein
MGSNQAANQRFDQAMKACGIGDKENRHLLIREKFHDHLENNFPDTKDSMEYKDLLREAKNFLRENYPNG